jgi:hypothetical protein
MPLTSSSCRRWFSSAIATSAASAAQHGSIEAQRGGSGGVSEGSFILFPATEAL